MNADEIAMKLAEAMGWKKWDALSEDKGWIEGDSVFVYHPSGIADSPRFHPDTRGDHIWICLEWAQKKFGPFRTTLNEDQLNPNLEWRESWFGENTPATYQDERDNFLEIDPLHIALAILKALG
ncbi:hypothetical protein LCGC14_0444050 [marine sediment metagenome]|uniref:Uncharacterized protein n=1 Tax=marine sediment metagenome TaxID=412755 RepID=A0A0F9V6E6_9ZZZZ